MDLETIIYFGKHKGKTLKQIQKQDNSYFKWLSESWLSKGLEKLNNSKKPIKKVYKENIQDNDKTPKFLCYICGYFRSKFYIVDNIRICHSCSDKSNANQIGRLVSHVFKKQNNEQFR